MSDQPDKSEQTEDPSERKLREAQRKGDVAKSQEVTTWFMTLGSALLFGILAPMIVPGFAGTLAQILGNAGQMDLAGQGFAQFVNGLAISVFMVALVPLVAMAIFAAAGNLVQHPPLFSVEPITPKLSRISPISGAKRLFSSEALVNFGKGVVKIGVVSLAIFMVMWPEQDRLDTLVTADASVLLPLFLELALKVFGVVIAIITVIAIADFMYQRFKWWERQKMTIKEVRDEYKQMEGDPQVKQRIRQMRSARSRQRMMSAVPEATVVITNPTHFAVALKYERSMGAPVCVAKGMDALALKIREVAKDADVPVIENPPLARALYKSVDIDETIPAEHFKAVAQLIGYVMRLKESRAWRA